MMTKAEWLAELANQRHAFLDLDPDSQHQCRDRELCHHGRPLRSAGLECPDCKGAQRGRHQPDYQLVSRDGTLQMCRACGRSMGTHNDKIEKGQRSE